jgi:WD40 repeat protein
VHTTYETVLGTTYSLAYAPNGSTFAAAGELAPDQPSAFPGSAPIALVEAPTGRTRLLYRGHTGLLTSDVAWAPNGGYIASAGYDDSTLQVWQAETGEQVFAASIEYDDEVLCVTWAPDCRYVAAATVRGLFVYEVPSDQLIASTPEQEASRFDAVAWSPHGNALAAIDGFDRIPGIYDPFTCAPIYRYPQHDSRWPALAIAWSPDGTRIASVSGSSIHVWVPPELL